MKGIILAGGTGSRLHPLTLVTSKQLLPVYNKPMIFYPLCTLMSAGIRDILIISTPQDLPRFRELLKDGSQFGIHLSYIPQPNPDGLAQAFLIGKDFIGNESVAMILGDNLFYGPNLDRKFRKAVQRAQLGCATIFSYPVTDPHRFGIVEFDDRGHALSITEKPLHPKSNYCVTGIYFYDRNVVSYASTLRFSKRGELEITDLNNIYLQSHRLCVELLEPGNVWMDMGSYNSLMDASLFIQNQEQVQNRRIGCPEETALCNSWISRKELADLCKRMGNTPYSDYLRGILEI